MSPGHGWKLRYGSSALIRHSMAWPAEPAAVALEADRLAGGHPDLLLHQVEAGDHLGHRVLDLDPGVHLHEVELSRRCRAGTRGAGADVADVGGQRHRRLRPSGRAARRRAPGWGSPRSASGGAAAPSSRARPGGRPCRSCRPSPGSRRGAGARGTSRRRPRRCRTPRAPRSAPGRRAGRTARRPCAIRIPFPPPPAVALMITGKPISSRERQRLLRVVDRARRARARSAPRPPAASRRAVALSPIWRIWSPVGPMKVMLDARQMSANSAFSARKP